MKPMAPATVLILFGLIPLGAQNADPAVMTEALAVREGIVQSLAALKQYTWTEQTEVLVKGKLKSTASAQCRYNGFGELTKTPAGAGANDDPNALSKRPMVRKKAEIEDYIERAVSLVHSYLPPKPDRIQYLLGHGGVKLEQAEAGRFDLVFRKYLRDEDSLTFSYDPASKRLVKIVVNSNLGNVKDPVKMEAVFETLPDGVNHLSSAVLDAPAKKVRVNTRNADYRKAGD